ncbi:MAG: glutathione S-transferase family protein [Rhodospirillaceae bacterium]|nr:glutathione S-transferase family protein [Rhodospirillaceae bacterium]MDD9925832.1 glutathione S-transferase family protein [Rhodospirillaceae bacterium]
MPNIELYGSSNSTFFRTARLACEEKGAPYDVMPVGENTFPDLKNPEHLARHPYGRIPAMRHGDVELFESTAICAYVNGAFDGPSLVPGDPVEHARMVQWISATNDYIVPTVLRGYIAAIFAPPGLDVETDEDKIRAMRPAIHEQIRILDDGLSDRTWLAGDALSIADLLLAPILHYLGNTLDGLEFFEGRDNIGRWWHAVSNRRSFQATIPPFLDKESRAA